MLICLSVPVLVATPLTVSGQSSISFPARPASTFAVAGSSGGGSGDIWGCGSVSVSSLTSFSSAFGQLAKYVSDCARKTTLDSDTCSSASPSSTASGSCTFRYHEQTAYECNFIYSFGAHTFLGGSVQECTNTEVQNVIKSPFGAAMPHECPTGWVYPTVEARNVSEPPSAHSEIWAVDPGDGTPECQAHDTQLNSGGFSITNTYSGMKVGGTVTWSNSCGSGKTFDQGTGECAAAGDFSYPKSNYCPTCKNPYRPEFAGTNPVNVGTGAKNQLEHDYIGPGPFPLDFFRRYTSAFERPGTMGRSWRHSYDTRILTIVANQKVRVERPDGREFIFNLVSGSWAADGDVKGVLAVLAAQSTVCPAVQTGWTYTTDTIDIRGPDIVETYDSSGVLQCITNRTGSTQGLTYSTTSTSPSIAPFSGLLIAVSDPFGRTISFGYDNSGRVAGLTDPAGGVVQFTYTSAADPQLENVVYQDNKLKTYKYNESANTGGANLPQSLTGVVDEDNSRFSTWQYDSSGRAIASMTAATSGSPQGTNKVTVQTNTGSTSTITDALAHQTTLSFGNLLGVVRNTSVPGPCLACGDTAATSFDAAANVSVRIDFNGNRTNYTYDTARNLETQRVEGLQSGGGTTAQTRTISTQWHSTFQLPAAVAEPLRMTAYTYNGDGSTTCGATGALCKMSIQPTTDTNGSAGFGATPVGAPREWNYTYNANGQVLTITGPRTADVTTYTYYANNDSDFGKRGNLATVVNAKNQTITISSYNLNGQPLTIVDPNGLTVTLTFDARQRLTAKSVGGETTTIAYNNIGLPSRVTSPDGSYLDYTYDAAHRLARVQDSLGNKIDYTLDAAGNRTIDEIKNPSDALVQKKSREFSDLGRQTKEIGATNPSGQITQFGYDTQGNLTTVTDPLSHLTTNYFDPLNRVFKVRDPAANDTLYGYDGLDALVQLTDPRSLVTTYTMDGLGRLGTQVSPDTGTTAFTYDAGGNVLTKTDAKSQQTQYVYDEINRVTSITFSDGAKQEFGYDAGTYGVGHLTSITEKNASNVTISLTALTYDQKGRITSDARTVNGVTYTTGYSYDSYGRLSGLSYPVTGRTVSYSFDGLGRISQVTTTKSGVAQTILSSAIYQPFGVAKGWTFGNAQTYARAVDQDGRISSYTLGSNTFNIRFDDASRIICISQTTCPSATPTPTPISSSTDAYTYDTASNRIATLTPAGSSTRNFTLDANGSTTSDGVNSFAYDTKGRMSQSTAGAITTTYQVNALGQRIRKTNSTEDTVYLYDLTGKLIAEGTAGGAITKEYVYLHDIPVAVIVSGAIYYIHPDHLNTPRLVSNQSQQWVWRWGQTDPFGNSAPDTQSKITLNLRFPGQYFDAETGLSYNYFRDCYDSGIGRFCQSDPIGLAGGANPYIYVRGNPISLIDPYGLFDIVVNDAGGRNGPAYGGTITVTGDNGQSVTVPGSSWPNPSNPSPGIEPGSYPGVYSPTGHQGRVEGVRLNDGGRIPTLGPNPAQRNSSFATGINLHCGFRANRRGSAGCLTIDPDYCQQVWDVLRPGETGTVTVNR